MGTHLASLEIVAKFRQSTTTLARSRSQFILESILQNGSRRRSVEPGSRRRGQEAQAQDPCARPPLLLMDVKCPGCFTITTVFSHAQTVVICQGCTTVLCQPTGGKARLTEGCSFRRK